MSFTPGQICAACVPYNNSQPEWIIARIKTILQNKDYQVVDIDADNGQTGPYTVSNDKITAFPAPATTLEVGEHVLALWYDEDNKDWSTMFYEAIIKEQIDDQKLLITFVGSNLTVQTYKTKIALFPLIEQEKIKMEEKIEQEKTDPNKRKIVFTSGAQDLRVEKFIKLSDEDFESMMKPNIPIRRLKSTEGTPLLDFLNDPILFSETSPHVTTCGSLSIPQSIRAPNRESGLMNSNSQVGRISKILHQWGV